MLIFFFGFVFLRDNNRLDDLLYAIYFKIDHLPLEFDLSSFVKIRNIKRKI